MMPHCLLIVNGVCSEELPTCIIKAVTDLEDGSGKLLQDVVNKLPIPEECIFMKNTEKLK
jgi:hypothetical protein